MNTSICPAFWCQTKIAPWKSLCPYHWARCDNRSRAGLTRHCTWMKQKGLPWPTDFADFGNAYKRALSVGVHGIAAADGFDFTRWTHPRPEVRLAIVDPVRADPLLVTAIHGAPVEATT